MTAVPALTRPPLVQVKLMEEGCRAEPTVWSGATGRMRPERLYVTYEAVMGALCWWVDVLLEGPTVRRDGTDGKAIAHQVYFCDEEGDSLQFAPEWVREFVRINEPPDYMRGA